MDAARPLDGVRQERILPDAAAPGVLHAAAHWLSCAFGYTMLGLAAVVVVEVTGRKFFGFSLQGADELGGYALAVGSTLTFSVALIERGHIRIDLFHSALPAPLKAALNWVSVLAMAAFAVLLFRVGVKVVVDTLSYHSTAATPWATPLIYPQGPWLFGLGAFALLACGLAVHATVLLLRGRVRELDRRYGPKGATEELREELDDLARR